MYHKSIFNRLPERFRKYNTDKLYYVLFEEKGAFFNAVKSVEDSRNIDKATGSTLDLIGGNVGQIRQGEDDELYRQLIKVRIIANMSIGDISTINLVLSTLVKEIYLGLAEAWENAVYDNEPAALRVRLSKLARSAPFAIVDVIKAAGVRVFFELYGKDGIVYSDKLKSYNTKFWMTNEIPSGRVPTQSYRGIKSRDTLRMGSSGRISDNKPYKTNEIRTNNTPNKGGNR